MFDLDAEKIQYLALFIMWRILLLFPAIICTGDKVCVKVSLKRAASNPVTILKSELRSDILLLSVALMLLGFFGLVPKTIKQVLWLGVSFSPLWTAHTTSKSESPSRSQSSLYSREVIPSVPGAAFRFDLKRTSLTSSFDSCCLTPKKLALPQLVG